MPDVKLILKIFTSVVLIIIVSEFNALFAHVNEHRYLNFL